MPNDFSACSASSAFKRRIFSQAVSRLTFGLIVAYFKSRVGRAYSGRPRESTEGRPQSQIPGEVGWKGAQASGPVKKPLTAESAETEEKKTLRSFGVLGVLGGKTAHFFHNLCEACSVD